METLCPKCGNVLKKIGAHQSQAAINADGRTIPGMVTEIESYKCENCNIVYPYLASLSESKEGIDFIKGLHL